MHKSAYVSGRKFFERYVVSSPISILEIGSYDVNGTLRDFQPKGSTWLGVDLEAGPGVDLVIENTSDLPFTDESFDYVVASSVFEHDPIFWKTFAEMIRVLKSGGCIYINSPSNGMIHRYPIDVYRFYPDAGKALEKWGKSIRSDIYLIESFIGLHNTEPWNDFCAVFGKGSRSSNQSIYSDSKCENVWDRDTFLAHTFQEFPEDQRLVVELQNKNTELQNKNTELQNKNTELQNKNTELTQNIQSVFNSRSWKISKPMRNFKNWLR